MKKSIILIVSLVLIGLWGCSIDDENLKDMDVKEENIGKSSAQNVPIPDVAKNQVVVRFKDTGLSNTQKEDIREIIENRYNFEILHKEFCDCDPDGPELWTIDTLQSDFIRVEELVTNLPDNSEEGVEGDEFASYDYQFYMTIVDHTLSGNRGSGFINKIIPHSGGDYINIAVMDTGIDYDFFSNPFLYSTESAQEGNFGLSGWDYTNHDKDIRDDYGHGSKVVKIITSELNASTIAHQILAIKTFDDSGTGSYYNIVCGMNYISKLPDIHIMNMSFGWYGLKDQSILKGLMEDRDDILYVSSAGNLRVNVDGQIPHFPSGYDIENIIAVGGYDVEPDESGTIDIFDRISIGNSNYGTETIDLAAPIDGYDLLMQSEPEIRVHPVGTSFSAAYITSLAAKLYDPRISTAQLQAIIMNTAFNIPRFNNRIIDGRFILR